jgi:hypothetical protein
MDEYEEYLRYGGTSFYPIDEVSHNLLTVKKSNIFRKILCNTFGIHHYVVVWEGNDGDRTDKRCEFCNNFSMRVKCIVVS